MCLTLLAVDVLNTNPKQLVEERFVSVYMLQTHHPRKSGQERGAETKGGTLLG